MGKKIKEGDIFSSNSGGDVLVVSYKSSLHEVGILFVDTMYETSVSYSSLVTGVMKDKLKPIVYGVGYIGDGSFDSKHAAYNSWRKMLERCYDAKYQTLHQTYIGCSVCQEWHNYQNYAGWYECNYPVGKIKYQLDKDIKIKGNKIYSPTTCTFVTQPQNTVEAKAKNYTFINPEGVVFEIYNLKDFCRDKDLCSGHMYKVSQGKRGHHKGWKAV